MLSKHQECGVIAASPSFSRYPASLTQSHGGTPAPQSALCTPSQGRPQSCTPQAHASRPPSEVLPIPGGLPGGGSTAKCHRHRLQLNPVARPWCHPLAQSRTLYPRSKLRAPSAPRPCHALRELHLRPRWRELHAPTPTTGGLARPPLPSTSPKPGIPPHGTCVTPPMTPPPITVTSAAHLHWPGPALWSPICPLSGDGYCPISQIGKLRHRDKANTQRGPRGPQAYHDCH